MIWSSGTVLNGGRYTIEEAIGHGRLSITYRAKQKGGGRVVIKTPNDKAIARDDLARLQERFIKEAFKLQKCEHPNIVEVFDPFQQEGLWCIPMEYIAGMTLAERDRPRLPESEALTYIKQVGAALEVLHGQNLIHRDVKPSNIMIRVRDGLSEAVLIDFGLVRDFSQHTTYTIHSETEELASAFKAPELYIPGGDRGSYTDLYALGAVLYELVTGYPAPTAIERKDSPGPLSFPGDSVSESVVRSIESAMAMKASDRPDSVKQWLEEMNSGPATVSKPPSLPKINWVTISAVLTAIAGLIAAIAAMVTAFQPKDSPTGKPESPKTTSPIKTEKTK
jgi:eukaryotic-like serine/threonine-protein kinase